MEEESITLTIEDLQRLYPWMEQETWIAFMKVVKDHYSMDRVELKIAL